MQIKTKLSHSNTPLNRPPLLTYGKYLVVLVAPQPQGFIILWNVAWNRATDSIKRSWRLLLSLFRLGHSQRRTMDHPLLSSPTGKIEKGIKTGDEENVILCNFFTKDFRDWVACLLAGWSTFINLASSLPAAAKGEDLRRWFQIVQPASKSLLLRF